MTDPKIIVALDYPDAAHALGLARQLDPALCRVKVGKELFTAAGPQLVEALIKLGFGVFLDLKFHDIPNTVAKACEAASKLGVWMLNVHASGGSQMMQAAREGVARSGHAPLLIAVTVLTSMNQEELSELGVNAPIEQHVLHLARLSQQAGLDGVVCSAQEAPALRRALGHDFCLVTPGIRPADAALDDQSRVVTPARALAMGSNYLVMGRPITRAADPLATLDQIRESILGK
ncbi:orotidine-5'-phosphate decarboxylase [Methylobacillus flagellatus]|uniref:Orotidine 5'-phosphate decarboxylase n=1 Tax=Methylobacillus flagellatus (strain ATCC 51484 / DSM 6875 / VKM B-1610 / KT) TaxID=265072 RepID=Q1H2F2_METFK|nr:orotidine-5'-phosphate decarboxylase [Methylobacillus flagellatus]ABE49191.1 orotidine 5'-phosphate decarboxylase [Methylobacillus flagellatus KT]ABE49335.1 orotidine-5'-phosphate decarboxylase [Methylobacillus flagellatus KT]